MDAGRGRGGDAGKGRNGETENRRNGEVGTKCVEERIAPLANSPRPLWERGRG